MEQFGTTELEINFDIGPFHSCLRSTTLAATEFSDDRTMDLFAFCHYDAEAHFPEKKQQHR